MPFRPRRSPRTGSVVLIAAAHALLLLALQAGGVWRDRGRKRVPELPLQVMLLAPPSALPQPAPAAPPRPARPAAQIPQATRAVDAIDVPPAAALPEPPPARAEAAPEPVRPLLLDLPRRASGPLDGRHPALDDPRVNTPPATLESRIARAVGSDRPTEENLGDGRLRFRKGSACVEVRPNAAGQLAPFNESARPSNRLATNC